MKDVPSHRTLRRRAIVALALLHAAGGLVNASAVDWALFEPACTGGASTLEIPCGDYGAFHFGEVQAPAGCSPVAGGSEAPPPYGQPGPGVAFPLTPPMLIPDALPAPMSAGAGASSTTVHQAAGAWAAREPGGWTPAVEPAVQPGQPGELDAPAWIAVIDFEGPHGESTAWLVDQVAGPDVPALLSVLDDPALAALGPVGDFHVLAKLCEIAELVDAGGVVPPRAVNMSFGRAAGAHDPDPPATCNEDRGSCQVARVVQHLRNLGTSFVAAAGNHQQLLFPAALPNVLAAGMLDVGAMFEGTTEPAWETPQTVEGLSPGNGLCLEEWAAPAGSSYSTAMLTGWLSEVLERYPTLDVTATGSWYPRWHAALGCWVLAQGVRMAPWCNDAIDVLFEGLAGDNENVCWHVATEPSVELPPPGQPQAQPAVPSIVAWAGETAPAPESDPCVPCVGHLVAQGAATDLVIDLSQAQPLTPGIFLDAVFLRVGYGFYELPLDTEDLAAMAAGDLAQIVLSGWGTLIPPGSGQPSLVHQMKTDAGADCTFLGLCFWTSTPLLIKT
jgi:hypothetical protein